MKQSLAVAALAAGAAALPSAALSGASLQVASTPSCIVSGSTERSCATAAWAAAADFDSRAGTIGFGAPLDTLESRVRTFGYGTALAALDKSVTECAPFIPWMTDLAGKTNFRRMGGWLPDWTEELAYIDTANLATRVTCPVTMGIGLGDYVCPPSGEMVLFRNLKGPKTLTATQNMGHGSQYGVESPSYTFKDAIR